MYCNFFGIVIRKDMLKHITKVLLIVMGIVLVVLCLSRWLL